MLYGYNFQNQTIYKLKFTANIAEAKQFGSEAIANDLLDTLPPTDTMIHIYPYSDGVRLANLTVIPISIVYDA
jgi:hypothetical protein